LLLIFLKPLIKLLDLFIPKNKHEILFYGYQGSYRGNVKYFFEYLLHYKNPLIIPIWISTSKKDTQYITSKYPQVDLIEITNKKEKIYLLWKLLRTKIIIYTALGDLWNLRKMLIPQKHISMELSNGITIKSAGINTTFLQNNKKHLKKFVKQKQYETYHIVSSELERYFLASCFNTNLKKFVITGAPRTDILNKQLTKNNNKIKKLFPKINFGKNPKNILYAPSHRDGNYFKHKKSTAPAFFNFDDYDFNKIYNNATQNNIHYLIRTHSIDYMLKPELFNMDGKLIESSFVHFLSSEILPDELEIADNIDLIITDYSGIYLDFLLIDIPVLFYPYDIVEYSKYRGLMFEFGLVTPGPTVNTLEKLLTESNKLMNDSKYYKKEREMIKNLYFKFQDFNSSERIMNLISSHI